MTNIMQNTEVLKAPVSASNRGAISAPILAEQELKKVLGRYFEGFEDCIDDVLTDVSLFGICAQSVNALSFMVHAAVNFRYTLEKNIKPTPDTNLYDNERARQEVATAFINAMAEKAKGEQGIDLLKVSTVVNEVLSLSNYDYETDKCPFTPNGDRKLPKDDLEKFNSYVRRFFDVCRFTGSPLMSYAVWTGKGYTRNPELFTAYLGDLFKSFHMFPKSKILDDFRDTVRLGTSMGTVEEDPRVILPVDNTVLHLYDDEASLKPLETKEGASYELLPYKRRLYVTNPMKVTYLPYAYDKQEDLMFDLWANHKPENRAVLEEVMFWIMCKNKRFKGCVILYGEGGGGKSMFFDQVCDMIGDDNFSNVKLNEMKGHNLELMLYARANTSDELPRGVLSEDIEGRVKDLTAPTKKTRVSIDAKYKNPVQESVPCLMMFVTNRLPVVPDKTARDRFAVIAFTKDFKTFDKRKYGLTGDNSPEKVIMRPQAQSYALLLALNAGRRMLRRQADPDVKPKVFRNFFTPCQDMQEAFKLLERESNSSIEWLRDYLEDRTGTPDSIDFSCLCWRRIEDLEQRKQELYKYSIDELHRLCEDYCSRTKGEDKKPLTPEKKDRFIQSILDYVHNLNIPAFDVKRCKYIDPVSGKKDAHKRFFVLTGNRDYCPR